MAPAAKFDADRALFKIVVFVAIVLTSTVAAVYLSSPKSAQATGLPQDALVPNQQAPVFSVTEAQGVTRLKTIQYEDTAIVKVTNMRNTPVRIRGVTTQGVTDRIWYGTSTTYDSIGHLNIAPSICDAQTNSEKGCNIVLSPGQWVYIQSKDGVVCNQWIGTVPASVNSIRQKAAAELKMYYEFLSSRYPVADAPTTISEFSTSLNLQCLDYWVCEADPPCYNRYGQYGADCFSGGCSTEY